MNEQDWAEVFWGNSGESITNDPPVIIPWFVDNFMPNPGLPPLPVTPKNDLEISEDQTAEKNENTRMVLSIGEVLTLRSRGGQIS